MRAPQRQHTMHARSRGPGRQPWPIIALIMVFAGACVAPPGAAPTLAATALPVTLEAPDTHFLADPTGTLEAIADFEQPTAGAALSDFLDDLSVGDYERAAMAYAGPYDTLIGWNPTGVDPEDRPGLLRAGCEMNGLQCLTTRTVEPAGRSELGLLFEVTFFTRDGALFERGPCCGGNATDNPPESDFTFTVVKIAGAYRVLELPPYVP